MTPFNSVDSRIAPNLPASCTGIRILFILLTLTIGCGRSDWGYVSGSVTLDGQAVGPGMLVFEPTEVSPDIPSAVAYFDESGQYELLSAGRAKGAPTGTYGVLVLEGDAATITGEGEVVPVSARKIPPRYSDLSAGLTATIVAGQQSIDFSLQP